MPNVADIAASLPRIAWTGGSSPAKEDKAQPLFRAIRSARFREEVRNCGGLGLWACAGTSALDRARIFWNRANLDAHATILVSNRLTAAKAAREYVESVPPLTPAERPGFARRLLGIDPVKW